MHLVIDARLPNFGVGGVQNVILSFAQGFQNLDNSDIQRTWITYKEARWLIPFIPKQDKVLFEKNKWISLNKFRLIPFSSHLISLYFILTRNRNLYDKIFDRIKPDLVILPFQNSLNTNYPYIYFPHDLLHEYYPQYFTRIQKYLRNNVWRDKALKARTVICETELVKRDLINFWGLDSTKIELLVTPPNVTKVTFKERANNIQLKEKIIYYPAAYWEHKNHKNLIKSLEYFDQVKYNTRLILSGHNVENCKKFVMTLPRSLQQNVELLGHVTRNKFEELFNAADVIAIPSVFESLSLVGFEALVSYKPIVCSDIPQFRLQMLDKALFFDPLNPKDIASKIQKIFVDSDIDKKYYYTNYDELLINFVESFYFICQNNNDRLSNTKGKRANDFMSNPKNFFRGIPNRIG